MPLAWLPYADRAEAERRLGGIPAGLDLDFYRDRPGTPARRLFGIFIGAALACTSGRVLVVSLRRRRGTVRTTGTMLGLEQVPSMSGPLLPSGPDSLSVSSSGPDYKPVIEFTTPGR